MSIWASVCKWGARELGDCLNDSGYSSDDIVSARFEALNMSRQATFSIVYKDDNEEAGFGHGLIYVWLENSGALTASF